MNEDKYRAPATFDGIGPFPITEWDEAGFLMDWSKYRFPHRRYQDVEALSVAPLVITGQIAFLNGVDGYEDLWPHKFMQMRRRCQLPRQGKYKHPLYGDVFGHFSRFDPQYRTSTLNGCIVQYTFEQDIDPAAGKQLDIVENNPLAGAKANAAAITGALGVLAAPKPSRRSIFSASSALDIVTTISQVDQLLQSSPPAPVTLPSFPSAGLLAVANKFPPFTDLVEGFDIFLSDERNTFDDIAAEAASIQSRFQELASTPEMLLPENAEVLIAATQTQAQIQQAALAAQQKAAIVVEAELDRAMTPPEVAMLIYEDPGRADEIMRLNPLDGTEYSAGTKIRFLDK
jgi:hypothetical protein